jgi:hypothetical protein
MQQTMWIPITSAIISVIAVTLSLIALWKTHFAKSRFIPMVGNLRLRIYPIKNEDRRWYIPSFDVPVSITNEGARPGKILGIRLLIKFPDLPIPDNKECFNPKWEVDGKQICRERFKWINEATVADWMPFVVLPKETVTKHLVFESSSWTEPVIQNRVTCIMEIRTDTDQTWKEIAKWDASLTAKVWGELTHRGTSFCYIPDGAINQLAEIHPIDLHKYTGSKEPIPEEGLGAAPSYLDFPKQSDVSKKND